MAYYNGCMRLPTFSISQWSRTSSVVKPENTNETQHENYERQNSSSLYEFFIRISNWVSSLFSCFSSRQQNSTATTTAIVENNSSTQGNTASITRDSIQGPSSIQVNIPRFNYFTEQEVVTPRVNYFNDLPGINPPVEVETPKPNYLSFCKYRSNIINMITETRIETLKELDDAIKECNQRTSENRIATERLESSGVLLINEEVYQRYKQEGCIEFSILKDLSLAKDFVEIELKRGSITSTFVNSNQFDTEDKIRGIFYPRQGLDYTEEEEKPQYLKLTLREQKDHPLRFKPKDILGFARGYDEVDLSDVELRHRHFNWILKEYPLSSIDEITT